MFRTATVRPKRSGPNILYNTSLNKNGMTEDIEQRALCYSEFHAFVYFLRNHQPSKSMQIMWVSALLVRMKLFH